MKSRLAQLIEHLSAGLVERDTQVRLALLAALSGEHLLLIGPPGTAKSDLARRLAGVFHDAHYFERLLTRFSVPEELFGPLSLSALEEDRYERQIDGYLPTATIAFIDEIFKANSAILNALLTLLNEREFDQGRGRIRTPLVSVIAASNEIPAEDFLAAFYDRFLLRCQVKPVSDEGFVRLLNLSEHGRQTVPRELQIGRNDLDRLLMERERVTVPAEVMVMLTDLRGFLAREEIHLSDRRWRKMLGVLKTAALTNGRNAVSIWDLWLTQFCACERPEQAGLVAEWFGSRLGTWKVMNPVRFTHLIEAFEAQLELEQNANDLAFDDSGKLAMAQSVGGAEAGDVAPRLSSFMRRRRYGAVHVHARVDQSQDLINQIDAYLAEIGRHMDSLSASVADHLWIAPDFAASGHASLQATRDVVLALRVRCAAVRQGFFGLPQLERGPGGVPEPMAASA